MIGFCLAVFGSLWLGGQSVNVDDFGAVGDGETFDHDAIAMAIAAAGEQGVVHFSPGKTYLICVPLIMKNGQTWKGHGATLKRCGLIKTLLVEDVPAGATSVQVKDASAFQEGMNITPVFGTGHYNGIEQGERHVSHFIKDISGNTLTFTGGLRQAYFSGDQLINSFTMVKVTNKAFSNLTVENLVFDGNLAENTVYFAWPRHGSLKMVGTGIRIINNRFINSQSDAVKLGASTDVLVQHNSMEGGAGAALHLSNVHDIFIVDNIMLNNCQQSVLSQHTEAAVTFSVLNDGVFIGRNFIQGSRTGAVGTIGLRNNHHVEIFENYLCGNQHFFKAQSRVEYEYPEDQALVVRDNGVYQSGEGNVDVRKVAPAKGIKILRNKMVDGYIDLTGVAQVRIEGNDIKSNHWQVYGDVAGAFSKWSGLVSVRAGSEVTLSGNRFHGGPKGLFIENTDGVTSTGIRIAENQFFDQTRQALSVGNINSLERETYLADYSGVALSNNFFQSQALEPGSTLVWLGKWVEFEDNCLDSNGHAARIVGGNSPAGEALGVFRGNQVRAAGSLLTGSSLSRLLIADNTFSRSLSPDFLFSPGVVVENNTVDPDLNCEAPLFQAVQGPSLVGAQPADWLGCPGDAVSLSVSPRWPGTVTYQWYRGEEPLVGKTQPELNLGAFSLELSGGYRCLVSTPCSSEWTQVAQVGHGGPDPSFPAGTLNQGLEPLTLAVDLACVEPGYSWQWRNLTSGEHFGFQQTQVEIPVLNETTRFEFTVTDSSTGHDYSAMITVLVAHHERFSDFNGDGCNSLGDLLSALPQWGSASLQDADGTGLMDVRDFLYIDFNRDMPCF